MDHCLSTNNVFLFFREGEYRFNLFEVQKKRHELIKLYEGVDSIRLVITS